MSSRVWCRPDRAGELAWTTRRLPTRFFTAPSGLLFCGANLAATRLPHPHLPCGFCFVKTRSLVGRAVLCPPDVSGCPDGGASRTCGTRPTNSLRFRVFALKMRRHGAMRPYQHNKFFGVATHRRGVRLVWPCNCCCAMARSHLGRRSSATGDGRAPGVDWRAAILAAVPAGERN